ncbi:hypothetical protein PVK06_043841 [Gossypium arboreum]|uniref:Reverse transcriptase n=1 Tax=Gossypium arboreum TaxID=29729 RepID=A0ABR0MPG3_GOSAR|nr:hypothetical protein PVK06_043841 [Gossypium arboreum]
MDNYLGLPLVIGKNKTRAFQHIVDRFSHRIKVFLIPKGTLDVMVSRMRSFWWTKKNKDFVKSLETRFGWQIRDGMIAKYGSHRWGFACLDGLSAVLLSGSVATMFTAMCYPVYGPLEYLEYPQQCFISWEEGEYLVDLGAGSNLGDDFRIFNLLHSVMNLRPPRSHRLVKPPIDVIKINVDATIHDTVVGIGIIAWAIFEIDCARFVNRLKFRRKDILIFGFLLKNIFDLLDSSIESVIEWVIRLRNRVADGLCKLAIDKRCTFSFNMEYQSDIHGVVLTDGCSY